MPFPIPEKAYDEIVQCAALICDTPIAMITLIDDNRQWFKAWVGQEDQESIREYAFCAHAILTAEVNDSDTLLALADKALYHAKENGRNRVSYLQDVHQPIHREP